VCCFLITRFKGDFALAFYEACSVRQTVPHLKQVDSCLGARGIRGWSVRTAASSDDAIPSSALAKASTPATPEIGLNCVNAGRDVTALGSLSFVFVAFNFDRRFTSAPR